MKSVFKVSLEIRFDREGTKTSKVSSAWRKFGITELFKKRFTEVKGTSVDRID